MSAVKNLKDQNHPFLNEEIVQCLRESAKQTISKLTQSVCECEQAKFLTDWKSPTDITGVLEMTTEPYKGHMYIHFDKQIVFHVIELITFEKFNSISSEVLDGAAEITNIIYGNLKTKLNPLGFNFKLLTPQACKSSDLKDEYVNQIRMLIPFKVLNCNGYIEIILV